MKRILIYTISIILLIGLLACGNNPDIEGVKNDRGEITNSIEPEIIVESPMTISNNELIGREDQIYYLRLKMINGKYYEDWNWGAYMGTIWEGEYELEIVDESGEVKDRIDLNKVFKESTLIFTSSFEIEFDDYNNDGDIDFTMGQFASSNIREYKLFTIRNHKKIELLPIENDSSLYIGTTNGEDSL